jgi:rhodanese-related sulfurtransferase
LTEEPRGLQEFTAELNASVITDILQWRDDPELGRIVANLQSHTSRRAFLNTFAEAMVARHLRAHGCELRFEVPTPSGRRSDFEVRSDDQKFYLHVKRLDTDRPLHNPKSLLAVSSQLRALERIARPYLVQMRWIEQLSRDQVAQLVAQAAAFILQGRVGDEMKARDHAGREIGGVRIIAPWEGTHVNVTMGLPAGFVDQAPRFRRLMHRAHQQFMPKADNVIVMCSDHDEDAREFETALLGSHIERWDAFPPRGQRVAHGRAADGFWHGQRFSDSLFAAWFRLSPRQSELSSRLWVRHSADASGALSRLLHQLFGRA